MPIYEELKEGDFHYLKYQDQKRTYISFCVHEWMLSAPTKQDMQFYQKNDREILDAPSLNAKMSILTVKIKGEIKAFYWYDMDMKTKEYDRLQWPK